MVSWQVRVQPFADEHGLQTFPGAHSVQQLAPSRARRSAPGELRVLMSVGQWLGGGVLSHSTRPHRLQMSAIGCVIGWKLFTR
jgi:hypothetical protein